MCQGLLQEQEKRIIIIPPITSSSNDKTFMALDETAQTIIEASLENVEELTRIENEIKTQSINNQETKTKPEKPIEQPSPYNTPTKQQVKNGPTTEEKLKEVNDIFDFTSPNTDAIRKIQFPLSIPSSQWSFTSPLAQIMNFSPTYGLPLNIIDSPSKLFNTPKKKQQAQTANRTNKTPVKQLGEYTQKNNKSKMDEDIDNFNQAILKQINNIMNKVDKNLPQIKL
ncbi:hypothetical protein ACTFIW_003293 [Dictyostelium discoideum]